MNFLASDRAQHFEYTDKGSVNLLYHYSNKNKYMISVRNISKVCYLGEAVRKFLVGMCSKVPEQMVLH